MKTIKCAIYTRKPHEEAFKLIGVTEQTYYRWRREYGGMKVGQAKWLNDLETEYARPNNLQAEAHLVEKHGRVSIVITKGIGIGHVWCQ